MSNSGAHTDLQRKTLYLIHSLDCSNFVNHDRVQVLSYIIFSLLFICFWEWTGNLQMISVSTFCNRTPESVVACVLLGSSELILEHINQMSPSTHGILFPTNTLLYLFFYFSSYRNFFIGRFWLLVLISYSYLYLTNSTGLSGPAYALLLLDVLFSIFFLSYSFYFVS